MFEQTLEQWAERFRELTDEAYDDGYVFYAQPSCFSAPVGVRKTSSDKDDINIMVGYRIQDSDDIDLFVEEMSI